MFRKEINPYTVSDKVTFRNVDKTLTLYVRSNASTIVASLQKAKVVLSELASTSEEFERVNAARVFARGIFGEEQGDQLVDFYNDPLAIITVLGTYFETRLSKIITKAQKK